MSRFLQGAVAAVLKSEGGYVNHPADPGGETILGISRRYFPSWAGWQLVDFIKTTGQFPQESNPRLRELALNLYEREFYSRVGGDELGSQELATEMLDQAINLGCDRAVRHLQEACNILNRNGKSWPEIAVDGKVGKGTLLAVSKTEPRQLLKMLNALQAEHYLQVVRHTPEKEEFIRGWLDRT